HALTAVAQLGDDEAQAAAHVGLRISHETAIDLRHRTKRARAPELDFEPALVHAADFAFDGHAARVGFGQCVRTSGLARCAPEPRRTGRVDLDHHRLEPITRLHLQLAVRPAQLRHVKVGLETLPEPVATAFDLDEHAVSPDLDHHDLTALAQPEWLELGSGL